MDENYFTMVECSNRIIKKAVDNNQSNLS